LAAVGNVFITDGILYRVITESETTGTAEVGGNAYSGAVTVPGTVDYGGITYTVTSIGITAFAYCSGLTSVSIPGSVTSIGFSAFLCCSNLTSISIPGSVTFMGNEAFSGCSGLISVSIQDGATSIGGAAFWGCSGLTSISIPDSVASIGAYAFNNCSSLTGISIPGSVASIEEGMFYDCSSLISIAFFRSMPPSFGADVFYGALAGLQIIVPHGTASDYGAALAGMLPAGAQIVVALVRGRANVRPKYAVR
jgi:hypothetical protein